MVVDHTSQYYSDMKVKLHEIIALGRVSSIEMISEQIGVEEEIVREYLQDLVEEGSIEGSLSSDGTRFFLADVKVSIAPVISNVDYGPEMKVADTKLAKIITLSGFIIIILGAIIRGFSSIDFRFDNVGTALFMIGLFTLIVGWIQISRANPPSRI
ncbi:hypothetical protein EU527_07570 [Candidatus Thorarchaeota archaeon]|nr:MAG: hypothetical protein EU527_07570 [Candidatus Thorarchaeota archaeon]